MPDKRIEDIIEGGVREIEYVIKEVEKRGYHDLEQESDEFLELRQKREYKDMIIGEIYEAYFLPKRHEFEWQIVFQIVETIAQSGVIEAIGLGVAGGATYDMLKKLLSKTTESIKRASLPAKRSKPFKLMSSDLDKIKEYFHEHKSGRISEIETQTGVPRERIYPLLKLLGFTHQRRKHNCLWHEPETSVQ